MARPLSLFRTRNIVAPTTGTPCIGNTPIDLATELRPIPVPEAPERHLFVGYRAIPRVFERYFTGRGSPQRDEVTIRDPTTIACLAHDLGVSGDTRRQELVDAYIGATGINGYRLHAVPNSLGMNIYEIKVRPTHAATIAFLETLDTKP